MTTEVPPYSGQQQFPAHPGEPHPHAYPAQRYSTAPPWATAAAGEPPAPAYGAVTPYGAPLRPHGQLLVRYPEEMHNAARPKPPALWPIAAYTFLFLLPGIISTARRAGQARRGRNGVAPYWITFAVSLVASWLVWGMIVSVGVPIGINIYETRITDRVEHNLIHDGQVAKSTGVAVQTATCQPMGTRGADGLRTYDCLLSLGDGSTGTIEVRADTAGTWTALGGTN